MRQMYATFNGVLLYGVGRAYNLPRAIAALLGIQASAWTGYSGFTYKYRTGDVIRSTTYKNGNTGATTHVMDQYRNGRLIDRTTVTLPRCPGLEWLAQRARQGWYPAPGWHARIQCPGWIIRTE